MSKREEESGLLTLPAAAVLPLRRALVEAVNRERALAQDWATRAYAYIQSEEGRADRKKVKDALRASNYRVDEFLAEIVAKVNHARPSENAHFHRAFAAAVLILPLAAYTGTQPAPPRKLQAPRKKDLPPLPSQTWTFSDADCAIAIDPEKRTLSWKVDSSNRAVEHAWAGVLGKALKAALDQVRWTRGTGGAFHYSDEHAQDAALDRGFNPVSVSQSFGPLGEQASAQRMGVSTARYRALTGNKPRR